MGKSKPVKAIGGRDLVREISARCMDCGWPADDATPQQSTDSARKHRDRLGHTTVTVITKSYRFRGDDRSRVERRRREKEAIEAEKASGKGVWT